MSEFKKFILIAGSVAVILFLVSRDYGSIKNDQVKYGVSFSRFHTDELQLDWREAFLAILNDLGARHFRFSAHWPITEPEDNNYNFEELDFQMEQTHKAGASVILAVGRRLPGWPECHVPDWAAALDEPQRRGALLEYIEVVVNRYKKFDNIVAWQIENEPYLTSFSRSTCGGLDEPFLDEEITLVRKLDPTRSIMVTDSGEFGSWLSAYKRSDVFGTSMYLYIWTWQIESFRYPISPAFFRIKRNIIRLLAGEEKESIVIELESEPWLLQPIIEAPLDIQMERMGIDKFTEIISFSKKTGFNTFYLWGAEWWYWLRKNNHPEIWNKAQELFNQ
jgi:hypothetical protein